MSAIESAAGNCEAEADGIDACQSAFTYTGQEDRSAIPRDTTHISVSKGVKVLPAELFRDFTQLVEVELADGLEVIERAVFAGCKSLQHVRIPNSVVFLGEGAFNGCMSLQKITIPDKIKKIEDMTFHKCTNLKEVGLCEGIAHIGNRAFKCCGLSDSLKIPDSVKIIDDGAFELCDGVNFVDLGQNSALVEIREKAFAFCFILERIKIPASVRVIGDEAFCNCQYLEEVDICDDGELSELGGQAFFACHSLESIHIPSSVTVIEEWTFRHCYKLTNVEFGEQSQLEQIKEGAFFDCKSLARIQLPCTLQSIGEEAFSGCRRLVSVQLGGQVGTLQDTAFKNCYSLRNIAIHSDSTSEKCFEPACHDLIKVFGSTANIFSGLKHRFDGLPIHQMCYQYGYNPKEASGRDELSTILCSVTDNTHAPSSDNNEDYQGKPGNMEGQYCLGYEESDMTMEQLQSRARSNRNNPEASKSNNLQDSLGMTPLHILACSSSKHDLVLYQRVIEYEPKCLITKDEWGCLPILYAVWLNVPPDILKHLILSQKSHFPEYNLSWESMIETLCRAEAPLDTIQMLFDLQQTYFPDQNMDWKKVAHLLTIRISLSLDFFDTWQIWRRAFRSSQNHDYHELIQELDEVQIRCFPYQTDDTTLQHLYGNLSQPLIGWLRSDSKYESIKTYRYLIKCSLPQRFNGIGVRKWRTDIATLVEESSTIFSPRIPRQFDEIHTRMILYEREYNSLTIAAELLELTLW
eukprot:CAMPEP_0183757150 /NCGR_PEP_ID=MMETSP0739-20130205/5530_1 /TAXON_ID=385413 /ORGANISM="Thalassiosira miniscula, Strain CCMP1093" /LENGTH=747 /DNA_ID=CAMNT_0025994505 /DNA_START=52 /DNA_END=2292 /DNA_ORIENTATION=-